MIKTIDIGAFSAPDYIATALEGVYGLDGQKNLYVTVVKGVGFVHAAGPVTVSGYKLPVTAMPFFLIKCSGGTLTGVPVTDSTLDFTLAEGETLFGSFRLKG